MRITNTMMNNNMMYSINNNLLRMSDYMKHLNSGKMVAKPSDNPVAAAKILRFNTDLSELEQYKKNVRDALSNLDVTENSIAELGEVLQRARELAVQAANTGVYSKDELSKIGTEIEQLTEHMITAGNFNLAGKYIFSGYNTDQPLLNKDGTFNANADMDLDNVTDATADRLALLVGTRESIIYSTHGVNVFGEAADFTIGGANVRYPKLIGNMKEFAEALQNGDDSGIQKFLGVVDERMKKLLAERADIGARSNRLELIEHRIDDDHMSFTGLLSRAQDTDMAEEIMLFKNAENVYRASLSTGAKVIQPTLVDFLR